MNGSTGRDVAELIRDRRQRLEQPIPGRRAVGGADRGGRRIGQRGARARDAVVEPQHPDPSARKHMVQRRIVDRIGRRLVSVDARDPSARRLRSACRAPASAAASDAVASRRPQRTMQEPARPAGVDDESRRDPDGVDRARALEDRVSALLANGLEPRRVQVDGAFLLRLAARARGRSPGRYQCVSAISSCGLAATSSCRSRAAVSANADPGSWKKNVNPRLRPHATSGSARCHVPPLRERPDARQVVAVRELLEQKVGQRRGGLADGESRVAPRSTSTTRCPACSSASAVSEPPNPDPTMATSASMRAPA